MTEVTLSKVEGWLNEISDAMKMEVSIDNPESILLKLNKLSVLLSLNSQCITYSEQLYNRKIYSINAGLVGMTATDKKITFNFLAEKELLILNLAKAESKDLHICCDLLRTMISYLKNEIKNIPQ